MGSTTSDIVTMSGLNGSNSQWACCIILNCLIHRQFYVINKTSDNDIKNSIVMQRARGFLEPLKTGHVRVVNKPVYKSGFD